MKSIGIFAALTLALLLQNVAAVADTTAADEQEPVSLSGGAWHAGKLVPCADGVVTSVHGRLEESGPNGPQRFDSGVAVEIKLPAIPRFLNGQPFSTAAVVHYDGDRGNKVMESEKRGDKVRSAWSRFRHRPAIRKPEESSAIPT